MKQKKANQNAKSVEYHSKHLPPAKAPSLPPPPTKVEPSKSYVKEQVEKPKEKRKKTNYYLGETCPDLQGPPKKATVASLEQRVAELERMIWSMQVEERARKQKRDLK